MSSMFLACIFPLLTTVQAHAFCDVMAAQLTSICMPHTVCQAM